MKCQNVVVRASKQDTYAVSNEEESKVFELFSIMGTEAKSPLLLDNIKTVFASNHLTPSETVIDFLNLAIAVYTADHLIERASQGYLGWNRYIKLHLPVLDLSAWTEAKETFEQMLGFLSGDRWEIFFRARPSYSLAQNSPKIIADRVSLFSGGLDSYIGAVDLLSQNILTALVGHHKSGPNELSHQSTLVEAMSKRFSPGMVMPFYFHVQPTLKNGVDLIKESSQRARSILFIALGISVANAMNPELHLNVPENGLISLNVPLTNSRLGSLSTRTTHPYFFFLLNDAIKKVGINNEVQNPYRFSTKGEMLLNTKDVALLQQTAKMSVSCSKPGHYIRWFRKDKLHCGHCTPCIIRRASMFKAGIDDGIEYVFDIKQKAPSISDSMARDYYAFMAALERNREVKISLLDLVASGPLPGTPEELINLKGVYVRGMDEVKAFLLT